MGIPVEKIDRRLAAAHRLVEAGKLDKAHKIYRDITAKYPGVLAGWLNLGALEDEIARQSDGPFAGKDAFARALAIRIVPTVVNDMANILLRNELRWQEAEMFYKEAVIRHGLQDAAENLAVCLLNTATVKNTPEGWREAWSWYEWRKLHKCRNHPLLWRGEPLKDRRIVIHFEQGFGDHIWALRFVRQAKEEGAHVICLCPPNTIRLAIAQPYIDEVYDDREDHDIPADFVTMLMSMPGYMLPGGMPKREGCYIETATEREQHKKLRVGLAWNGSVDKGYQAWRNIDPRMFFPLIEARPDIEFVSLQKGAHEDDAPELNIDRESLKECFDLWDTARLIESLDLVIATDTLIPHLSAALGVETWLLDRWSSCWQWGIGDTDPGWYEQLTIHRQPSFKDWESVMQTILEKLKSWRLMSLAA